MDAAAGNLKRIPWLRVKVQTAEGGGVGGVEITCSECQARSVEAVGAGDAWFGRVTAGLNHEDDCPVPGRMRKARSAWLN